MKNTKIIITTSTIADRAIDFAARIHCTADLADRAAIARYGGCLIMGARIGATTLAKFSVALANCWTQEYEDFTQYLTENEVELLENSIAKIVARLNKFESGLK